MLKQHSMVLVLAALTWHAPALAQSTGESEAAPAADDAASAPESVPVSAPAADSAPTPAETAAQAPAAEEPAPAASAALTAPSAGDSDDGTAGWAVIGIGGSMGAANIALGASLLVQGQTNAEQRLGSATLTAGITGLAASLPVGLLML